jgi:hypothetical protein
MLTRVACILITGVLVTPTFTTAPANCWGAPIIAAGAGHLPFVGRGRHGDRAARDKASTDSTYKCG